MTEIKRLSDEDIEKLKNSTLLKCSECPVGVECGDTIYENNTCKETSSHFIQLEMEARERDKMEEKQLQTESELRAELENVCNVVNKIGGLSAEINDCKDGNLQIKISTNRDRDYVFSKWKQFRPDIEPPAKRIIVVCRRNSGMCWPFISLGRFDKSGGLEVAGSDMGAYSFKNWCVIYPETRTPHHSAGWDMAWLKGVE